MRRNLREIFFKGSSARRLVLAIILFSSVITIVTTAVQVMFDYRHGLNSIERDIENIRSGSLDTIVSSVWVSDTAQVQTILDGLLRLPDVEFLGIEVEGELRWQAGQFVADRIITETFPLQFDYRDRVVDIGVLTVVSGLDDLYASLAKKVFVVLVGNGLKTFLVSGFTLVFFQFLFARHLARIADWARGFRLGDEIPALSLARRARAGPDELDQVVAAFNDMRTNLGASYERLRSSERELERRVAERTAALQAAQEQLVREERQAALGELTAKVGHELRHPFGVIQNSMFLLRNEFGATDAACKVIARAERGVLRCERLVGELRRYAQEHEPGLRGIMLDGLLADILTRQTLPTEVRLHVDLGAPGIEVLADPSDIEFAISQLIQNASDALLESHQKPGSDPSIMVDSRVSENTAFIRVSDNGPGIPPKDQAKIFEPLFSTKGFGVGLGLPTVRRIVEQHEGQIQITSEEQGTVVTLSLPIVQSSKIGAAGAGCRSQPEAA